MDYPNFPDVSGVSFRHVPLFPGYCAGDDGSIWSCRKSGYGFGKTKPWTKLKPGRNTNGRFAVTLMRDRKPHRKQVHQVILLSFVGKPPQGKIGLHYDGDHDNSRLSNLRYGTFVENEDDKNRHGRRLRGDNHPVAKLNSKKVLEIRKILSGAKFHGMIAKIARKFGVDEAVITRIRDGKAWNWVA